MLDDLPGKLISYLKQTNSCDDQQKLVRQALEHFKDTRDPTLVQEVKSEAKTNQETPEVKRLREENNILRKGVRALNNKNNQWCKTESKLKEKENEINSLQF